MQCAFCLIEWFIYCSEMSSVETGPTMVSTKMLLILATLKQLKVSITIKDQ